MQNYKEYWNAFLFVQESYWYTSLEYNYERVFHDTLDSKKKEKEDKWVY